MPAPAITPAIAPAKSADVATTADIRRYVDGWNAAGTALEAEKLARLRAMSDDEARAVMHAILAMPLPENTPSRTCGLVEQQMWFQKLRPAS